MIRLLQFIIFGHIHKWKETGEARLVDGDRAVIGRRVFTVCEKCGAHRKWDLS